MNKKFLMLSLLAYLMNGNAYASQNDMASYNLSSLIEEDGQGEFTENKTTIETLNGKIKLKNIMGESKRVVYGQANIRIQTSRCQRALRQGKTIIITYSEGWIVTERARISHLKTAVEIIDEEEEITNQDKKYSSEQEQEESERNFWNRFIFGSNSISKKEGSLPKKEVNISESTATMIGALAVGVVVAAIAGIIAWKIFHKK